MHTIVEQRTMGQLASKNYICCLYLFKAGSYSEGNVDENRSNMSLVDLGEDARETRHGLHGNEVFWVFTIIHARQHGTQDGGREMRHL